MCITRVPSWYIYVLGSPSGSDLVVLSKVFVVRYYRVGCLYYWRKLTYYDKLMKDVFSHIEIFLEGFPSKPHISF